jgi:hypothetical protein
MGGINQAGGKGGIYFPMEGKQEEPPSGSNRRILEN